MKTIKNIFSKLIFLIVLIGLVYYVVVDDIKLEDKPKTQERQIEVKETIKEIDSNLKIYFIDVGQADSILIEKDNEYALIDAGNNRDGKKLVNYFKELNVPGFKYIFVTHPHEDHIGGVDDVLKNFEVERVFMLDVVLPTRTFEEVVEQLENKDIYYETPIIGSTFDLGDAIIETIYLGEDEEDLNNSSIVLRLTYKETSYLFMADAEKETEDKIIDKNIQSTVLKVGHHGTKYASSKRFIEKVNPKYSIITVGKDNEYGFPKEQVLNNLKEVKSKIYRTDLDGTIILTSDGKNIKINKKKTDTNGEENEVRNR